jgi:hypothetical protein
MKVQFEEIKGLEKMRDRILSEVEEVDLRMLETHVLYENPNEPLVSERLLKESDSMLMRLRLAGMRFRIAGALADEATREAERLVEKWKRQP